MEKLQLEKKKKRMMGIVESKEEPVKSVPDFKKIQGKEQIDAGKGNFEPFQDLSREPEEFEICGSYFQCIQCDQFSVHVDRNDVCENQHCPSNEYVNPR